MSVYRHNNLFEFGDKAEIYQALQRDFHRDVRRREWWQLGFALCAIGAGTLSHHWDWLWIFAGLFLLERGLTLYIDNSNRNWTMHVIDWLENSRDSEATGQGDGG